MTHSRTITTSRTLSRATSRATARVLANKERVFYAIMAVMTMLVISYALLMQRTVVNVVQSEQMTKQMKVLAQTVNNLEQEYLKLDNGITHAVASARGFKDPITTRYISRPQLSSARVGNEL